MNLHRNDRLKLYLGQLKYQKEKMLFAINLIDKYVCRIEENISEIKCAETCKEEEYKNKDLVIEVEEFIKELSGGSNE